jgi:EAL domain-containing protein (putative c-di-GMP-specific phosphodiesterase class I)
VSGYRRQRENAESLEGGVKDGSGLIDRTGLEDAVRRAADPVVLMKRVADEAMNLVEGIDGVLVGVVNEPGWITFECGAGNSEQHIGKRIPVDGSLSGLAFRTSETLRSDDAQHDPCVDFNFTRATGTQSLVCVPLWRRSETVGVLCVSSLRPDAFNERDVATLTSLAEFISVVIAVAFDLASVTDTLLSQLGLDRANASLQSGDDLEVEERFVVNVLNPGAMARVETRSWIDRFLRGRGLTHQFQPVFDITTGECFAVEALARFSGQPSRPPDLWFAEAHEMGVGVELELTSVQRALSCLERLPAGIDLCLNASPRAMVSDELRKLLAASDPGRIVMELTEEARVDDYEGLSSALEHLYCMGVRLAIDDTGAGFSSLAHILKLVPNLIKLDRELTSGINCDPVRITLANALVSFAAGLGAEIIAEGVETKAEFEMLSDLGIRYVQGFFLCRPTSLDSIPARLPQELSTTRSLSDTPGVDRSGRLLAFPARR